MFNRIFDSRSRKPEQKPLTSQRVQFGTTTSTEYENPVFDRNSTVIDSNSQNDLVIDNKQMTSDGDDDDLAFLDFEGFEEALKQIDERKLNTNLDITALDRYRTGVSSKYVWRNGPVPLEEGKNEYTQVKIGSLEPTKEIEDSTLSDLRSLLNKRDHDQITNEESTGALLQYFCEMGSCHESIPIDYFFIEQLLIMADINVCDKYGQTIMHEVAREWNTDLAEYLKLRGADIDQADQYGRTPLFVAVSSNHVDMAKWLIDQGANIHKKTMSTELQMPIHFAAKHDAIECFELLVEHGANPCALDGNGQTPMFLAAHYGQNRMVLGMLGKGLSSVCVSHSGVLCIELIVANLPSDTAWMALNQYTDCDKINRQEIYHIINFNKQYVSTVRGATRHFQPPNLLEILVENKDHTLITHPVILQIVKIKGKVFGTKLLRINVLLYLLFTLLWTASISIRERSTNGWTPRLTLIFVLTIFGTSTTVYFVWKIFQEYNSLIKFKEHEKKRVKIDLHNRSKYVHPRWRVEERLIEKEREKN